MATPLSVPAWTQVGAWCMTDAQRCWLDDQVVMHYVSLLPTGWQHLVKASAPPMARLFGNWKVPGFFLK